MAAGTDGVCTAKQNAVAFADFEADSGVQCPPFITYGHTFDLLQYLVHYLYSGLLISMYNIIGIPVNAMVLDTGIGEGVICDIMSAASPMALPHPNDAGIITR